MKTQVRTLTRAVAAAFGATVIALGTVSMIDQFADLGAIASAHAKDEGGSSGSHSSGGSTGGHTSGGGESSGGHSGGSGGATGGGHSGGGATGGGHSGGGATGGGNSGGGATGGGHSGGGAAGGGHSGGGAAGGGHSAGGDKGGGPNTASHRYGLERATHGTKAGHEGHASGVHGRNAKHGATAHVSGADRRFGGGSGLGGLEQVLEGPARFGHDTTLTQSASAEPGPRFRFRYWGGWTIPDDGGSVDDGGTIDTADAITPYSTDAITPYGAGGGPLAKLSLPSAARCDDVGGGMRTKSFYSAANLARLDAARTEIDPDALSKGRGADPTLMINVQEDLVDGRVDPLVIGSYLGMMATSTVTPEVIKRVAFRLCAPVTDENANRISQVAERVRFVAGTK